MALPTGDNVEELIYRITVESEQALSNIGAFRTQVDAMKAQLKKTAQETGEDFNFIATSMRKTFVEDSKASIQQFREQIKEAQTALKGLRADLRSAPATGVDPAAFKQAQEQIRQSIVAQQTAIESYRASIRGIQTDMNNFKTVSATALKEVNQETKEAGKSFKLFGVEIKNIGDLAKAVFVGLLGGSVLVILRNIVRTMGELAQKGLEFNKAVFQLEVGVRALRRAGVDLTFDEVLSNLEGVNENLGGLFSKLELIKGAAAFTNLIRDLGLAKEQVLALQEATTTLAVVNGRDMADVQRTVALAISSGYTEGLQRLGVSINRLTIAEEANRLGFKGGYTALTEQQRALATYNLIVRKTAIYTDDLARAQDTLFGSIQKSTAEIENQKTAIGEGLVPVQAAWLKFVAGLLKFINIANPIIQLARAFGVLSDIAKTAGKEVGTAIKNALPQNFIDGIREFNSGIKSVKDGFGDLQYAAKRFFDDLTKRFPVVGRLLAVWAEGIKKLRGELTEDTTFEGQVDLGESQFSEQQDLLVGQLEEQFGDITDMEEEFAEEVKKINADLQKDLAKITQDGVDDRRKIQEDFHDDMEKMERDFARRIQEVLLGLNQKLQDIDIKLKFDIEEAKIKLDFDIEEVQRKFNEDVAKANEEFRQKELERERKFQEEMLQLREEFLFDLEEALEKRDARAVLRAIKRFNLDKVQATRENELAKLTSKENLQNELKELALRRDARIRELKFEFEQRKAELERNAQFAREQAARNAAQDIADLRRKLAEERAERLRAFEQEKRDQALEEGLKRGRAWIAHMQELADLKKQNDAKLALIASFLIEQGKLLGLSVDEMTEVINAAFGEGGVAPALIRAYADFVRRTIEELRRLISGAQNLNPGFKPNNKPPSGKPNPPSFASGGAVVAKMPTTVQFGEVPELAIFAPLSQLDRLPDLLGGLAGGGASGGNLGVKISLSPGLEAEITDNAVGQVAEIIFERNRTREAF